MFAATPDTFQAIRSVLADLPVPVAVLDQAHGASVHFLNDSFVEAFGFAKHDVPTARAWAERVYPDAAYRKKTCHSWWAQVEERKQTGKAAPPQEHRIVDNYGRERIALVGFALHGQFVIITLQDVTRERSVEAALDIEHRKAEQTAHALTENMPGGAYTMVLKPGAEMAEFAFLSDKFLDMLELTRAEAVGDPSVGFSRVHPEDHSHWLKINAETFANKRPFSGETRIIAHGQTRWIRAESVPRGLEDGTTIWEGILVDITELKEAEAKLRTVLDAARAFIWTVDLQTLKVTYGKDWPEQISFLSEGRAPSLQSWFSAVHPHDVDAVRMAYQALVSGEVAHTSHTYRRRMVNDRWAWLRLHAGVSAHDPDGKPTELSGVTFDVSDEVAQQQQAQHAQAELREELQRAQQRDTFALVAGAVVHDIKNLIAVISGTVEVLEERTPDPGNLQSGLQRIGKSARLVVDLIADLGSVVRPMRPRQHHDLRKLLREGLDLLGSQRLARHLVRLYLPDHPLPVWANPTELAQLIVNLAINACESGLPGQDARVTVTALPAGSTPPDYKPDAGFLADIDHPHALFTVSDTGTGISADIRQKLFQPRFPTKGKDGTGLGLSIVADILSSSGSALWIDTTPGAGTKMTIAWPAQERRNQSAIIGTDELPVTQKYSAAERGMLKGLRVLVVDDLQDVADVLAGMLESAGADAFAESELDGVQEILSDTPEFWSVLVTDLHMPGMMGDELARFAARLHPPVPTVLVTARSDLVNPATQQDFAAILSKPVNRAKLASAVLEAASLREPRTKSSD